MGQIQCTSLGTLLHGVGGGIEFRLLRPCQQISPLPTALHETESAGGNFEGERSQLGEAMQGQERGERS